MIDYHKALISDFSYSFSVAFRYSGILPKLNDGNVHWRKENHPWVFGIHICMKDSRMFHENTSADCLSTLTTSTEDGAFQTKGHNTRILSPEEAERLAKDRVLVSDFKQLKLEKEAQKNWDLFYKRNSTNFFKDRHWTTREFQELKACREVSSMHFLCNWWDWLFSNELIVLG